MLATYMPYLQRCRALCVGQRQSIFDLFNLTIDADRLQFLNVDNAAEFLHHQFVALVVESSDALVEETTIFD